MNRRIMGQRGMSLLELIIVMAIIGILAAIAVPLLKNAPRRAQEAALKQNLRVMRDAIEQHNADKGHYPPSLQALVEEEYLRVIPLDPITRKQRHLGGGLRRVSPPLSDEDPWAETDLSPFGDPGIEDVHSGSEENSLGRRGLCRLVTWCPVSDAGLQTGASHRMRARRPRSQGGSRQGFRGTGRKPPGFRGAGAGRSAAQAPGPADRSSEAGYNLVVLAVLITVMNIAVAAALPYWSSWAKREKEAELIFRGLQYAEAIRLFRVRQGRLPTALEELIEVKPRVIRQLWPNPMDEEGALGPADAGSSKQCRPAGEPPRPKGRNDQCRCGRRRRRRRADRRTASERRGGRRTDSRTDPGRLQRHARPLDARLGVARKTTRAGTSPAKLIQLRPGNVTDGRPPPRLTSEWIGKPFPPGLLETSKVQDGSAPGERNRERNR